MPSARLLSAYQVIAIHDSLIEATGGTHGLRDLNLLEAAIGRPHAGGIDDEFFPTIFDKAAALLHALITAHPFIDGNKRTGMVVAIYVLEIHGWELEASQTELEDFAVHIALEKPVVGEIAEWLKANSTSRHDRPDDSML